MFLFDSYSLLITELTVPLLLIVLAGLCLFGDVALRWVKEKWRAHKKRFVFWGILTISLGWALSIAVLKCFFYFRTFSSLYPKYTLELLAILLSPLATIIVGVSGLSGIIWQLRKNHYQQLSSEKRVFLKDTMSEAEKICNEFIDISEDISHLFFHLSLAVRQHSEEDGTIVDCILRIRHQQQGNLSKIEKKLREASNRFDNFVSCNRSFLPYRQTYFVGFRLDVIFIDSYFDILKYPSGDPVVKTLEDIDYEKSFRIFQEYFDLYFALPFRSSVTEFKELLLNELLARFFEEGNPEKWIPHRYTGSLCRDIENFRERVLHSQCLSPEICHM